MVVLIFVVLCSTLSQRCIVSLNLVDTTTKITTDSESKTPVSYKWRILTFSLSSTIFALFAILFIMGKVNKTPKSNFLAWEKRVCEHCARRFGAPCDLSAWRRNSVKNIFKKYKKLQVVSVSPHRPDDPRRVANLKLCPLRQTHELIFYSNFQLPHGPELGVSY